MIGDKCNQCQVNTSEYALINGEERNEYCTPCFQDVLLDLVTHNEMICFVEKDDEQKVYEVG